MPTAQPCIRQRPACRMSTSRGSGNGLAASSLCAAILCGRRCPSGGTETLPSSHALVGRLSPARLRLTTTTSSRKRSAAYKSGISPRGTFERAAHTEERSAHRRRGFTRHSLHSDRPARSPRRSGRQPFLQPCRAAVRRSRPRRRCGRCHGAGTTANRDVGASTHAYHDPEQVRSRAAWARLAGILRRSGVMNPLPPNYKNSLVQEPRLSEEVAAAGIARLP